MIESFCVNIDNHNEIVDVFHVADLTYVQEVCSSGYLYLVVAMS